MSYGDTDNVKRDVIAIMDILARQGTEFVLDVMAEKIGMVVNQFKLKPDEVKRVLEHDIEHFRNAVEERT